MRIIKTIFFIIAVSIIIAGLTIPLWLEKMLPYLSAIASTNPDTSSENNYDITIPPGMPEINAERRDIPVIISILNDTDKSVVRFIKSITIVDDMNELRSICGDAIGCASITFENNIILRSSIYIASKKNYDPGCGTFEMILHHEIGHVVYSYQYGQGYDRKESEAFARKYAGKFYDPRDAYGKVAASFDLDELKCVY